MATKTYDTDVVIVGKASQSGTPSSAGDLATKAYVDAIPSVTSVKRLGVRAGSVANVTVSGLNNGVSFGGVTLATGDHIFLGGQTAPAENGPYTVRASGGPLRHVDFDASGELVPGTQVFVTAGTLAGNTYVCSAIGATPWVPNTSTSTWTAGTSSGTVIVAQDAPPSDTSVIWADTDEIGIEENVRYLKDVTTTTYTLILADRGKLVLCENVATQTITIPTNATAAFVIGTQLDLVQMGAGQVVIAPAGGVTVRATPTLNFRAQYSSASLIKIDTNEWLLIGDLST